MGAPSTGSIGLAAAVASEVRLAQCLLAALLARFAGSSRQNDDIVGW